LWWWWIPAVLAAEDFDGRRYYFGDIHAHTGASGDGGSADLGDCIRSSDGSAGDCGAVADLEALIAEAGLDFVATVDHVTSVAATTTESAFNQVFSSINSLHNPGAGLVTIPGAEIFVELPDGTELGHRSLLMFGLVSALDEISISDLQPSGSTANTIAHCGALSTFMTRLEDRFGPALLIPHHPGVDKPMPTDWTCHDARWAPVVEAYSEHGSSLDADSAFDPPWSGFVPESTVLAALDPAAYDLRLGLVGGSDNHDTHPGSVCRTDTVLDTHPYGGGLTGVVLEEATPFGRLGLYEAFRARRTYTTTGPKVPMRLDVLGSGGAVLAGMGEVLTVGPTADITLEVSIPMEHAAVVDSVTLLGPETSWVMDPVAAGVWRLQILGAERPSHVLADVRIDGASWFLGGCDDGGEDQVEHLWSSPIWFEVAMSPDADADGFTVADGDCEDSNPFIYPGAPEACLTPGADHDCDGWVSEEDPDCAVDTGEPDTGPMKSGRLPGGDAEPPPKSGCSTASKGAGVWAWWAVLCVVCTRRERS
jgi:hypothetical protein